MVLSSIGAIFTVLIIIAVGYLIGRVGWAGKEVTNFISKLIVKVTLPCTAVVVIVDSFDKETISRSWVYIVAAAAAVGIVYAASKIVIRVAKIEQSRRGVFTALFSYSNSVFIGLPVATAIFGEEGIAFALLYYICNTAYMNSIGYVEIARDGLVMRGEACAKVNAKIILKQIFQPPMLAVILGFILVMANVRLPDFLQSSLRYMGGITSPLALIFIGVILQRAGISSIKKIDKSMVWVLIGRFVLSPLSMLAVANVIGMDSFATSVFAVQIGLPAITQTAIFAEISCADTEYATKGVVLTTLLSFITIPIWVAILQ